MQCLTSTCVLPSKAVTNMGSKKLYTYPVTTFALIINFTKMHVDGTLLQLLHNKDSRV